MRKQIRILLHKFLSIQKSKLFESLFIYQRITQKALIYCACRSKVSFFVFLKEKWTERIISFSETTTSTKHSNVDKCNFPNIE